jgi:hypothetical protein
VWNPETDTIETMRDAVTHNTYIQRRCHPQGSRESAAQAAWN